MVIQISRYMPPPRRFHAFDASGYLKPFIAAHLIRREIRGVVGYARLQAAPRDAITLARARAPCH